MSKSNKMIEKLQNLANGMIRIMDKWIRRLPKVKNKIDTSIDSIMMDLESSVKPYNNKFKIFSKLPTTGYAKEEILKQIEDITSLEESHWKEGYVSGAIYHGDKEHIDFLNQVYALQSQNNPLHVDIFPSAVGSIDLSYDSGDTIVDYTVEFAVQSYNVTGAGSAG